MWATNLLFNATARVYTFRLLVLVNVVSLIVRALDIHLYENPASTQARITSLALPALILIHHALTYYFVLTFVFGLDIFPQTFP